MAKGLEGRTGVSPTRWSIEESSLWVRKRDGKALQSRSQREYSVDRARTRPTDFLGTGIRLAVSLGRQSEVQRGAW